MDENARRFCAVKYWLINMSFSISVVLINISSVTIFLYNPPSGGEFVYLAFQKD